MQICRLGILVTTFADHSVLRYHQKRKITVGLIVTITVLNFAVRLMRKVDCSPYPDGVTPIGQNNVAVQ